MDPNQTLKDILLTAQIIGQPCTETDYLDGLAKIAECLDNLLTWHKNGGFKPELYVSIDLD